MNLKDSETSKNLMRAFIAESQELNRYLYAAKIAEKENLQVIQKVFEYTMTQERAHGRIYSNRLKELTGTDVEVYAKYPVDGYDTTLEQLEAAVRNEYREYDVEYANFAKIAKEEGFKDIAASFSFIAEIEKEHGDRFNMFLNLLKEDKLFKSDEEEEWICLNCGHVHTSKDAPEKCPTCNHPQGFFVRKRMSPYNNFN